MKVRNFLQKFNECFSQKDLYNPTYSVTNERFKDPCPDIIGMTAVKNQKLLNIAFSCIESDECYLEVGTYIGKSLVSAMLGNSAKTVYACDMFCQFAPINSYEHLMSNLRRYNLVEKVIFFNSDFAKALNKDNIKMPVGLYYFDALHTEESQYKGIKLVEPLLSDEALVIVDDWRIEPDDTFQAKPGTEKAISESDNKWDILFELPSRYNSDRETWWNGVGVLSFQRVYSESLTS